MSARRPRRALVTGGTRGIGRELVAGLLADGAEVWSTGRTAASVEAARSAFPQVHWQVCDLADATARAALVRTVLQHPIETVIHNAGVQQLRDFTHDGAGEAIDLSEETAINLLAPVALTRAVLPALRERPGACVLFVTSGLALSPKQSSPVYCASKAGLRAFARCLRAQMRLQQWPVRIVEALPPLVDTDMTRGRGGPRKMAAADAARQILRGLAAGQDEIDVGATRLLRMLMRISPRLGDALLLDR